MAVHGQDQWQQVPRFHRHLHGLHEPMVWKWPRIIL